MSDAVQVISAVQDLILDGWVFSVDRLGDGKSVIDLAINEEKGQTVQFSDHEDFVEWALKEQQDLIEKAHTQTVKEVELKVEEEVQPKKIIPFTDTAMYKDGEGFSVGNTTFTVHDTIDYELSFLGILELVKATNERKIGVVSTFEDERMEGYHYQLLKTLILITVPVNGKTVDVYLPYKGLAQITEELKKVL